MSSAAADTNHLSLNLLYRLRAERIRTYPFDHFYGCDVFDKQVSENIRLYWPNGESFESISKTNRVSSGSYKQRKIIALDSLVKDHLRDRPAIEFWDSFYTQVSSDAFLSGIIDWLWPSIRAVRQLPEKINLFSEIVLTDDDVGYALTPHTDAPSRLVTILFFVPENKNADFAGTSLYVRKNRRAEEKVSAVHQPRNQFDLVYTAPFLPDSALGFVVGPTSFHGVEPIDALPTSRRQIQYVVRWQGA